MTPFLFRHEFHGEQSRYWELFFDEESTTKQLTASGMKTFSIDELVRKDGVWRRVVSATPARDLPAVIRKVTGASLGYTETTELDEATGKAVTKVVTSTLSGRIDFGGTHILETSGPTSFFRVFEGQVEVRVPIVGKRIEKLIVADMDKSYAQGAQITQAALTTAGS